MQLRYKMVASGMVPSRLQHVSADARNSAADAHLGPIPFVVEGVQQLLVGRPAACAAGPALGEAPAAATRSVGEEAAPVIGGGVGVGGGLRNSGSMWAPLRLSAASSPRSPYSARCGADPAVASVRRLPLLEMTQQNTQARPQSTSPLLASRVPAYRFVQ